MNRQEFLVDKFLKNFKAEPTSCQSKFFDDVAAFITSDDSDILVVNGYAGTGKTTAISAVINALKSVGTPSVLLAPTGRAAKVLSNLSGRSAQTIHKHIYRQKSVGDNGYGKFSLAPNKARSTLFVVDEVSLISVDTANENASLFGTGNLLDDLVAFVREGDDCRLVLIGDAAQLPPVGLDYSPALYPDYIKTYGGVRFCELTTVVRQAKESGILRNATTLRHLISNYTLDSVDLKFDLQGISDVRRISGGELIETLSEAYDKYGEDETIVLCRSNKRANRYNNGIRAQVQYKEDQLVRGDSLMIVKNCYQFLDDIPNLDYIANGDIAKLERIGNYEERYGLHFAQAQLTFPDYDDVTISAKVILDTLNSESASLNFEQQNALYQGVSADYALSLNTKSKARIWKKVREDKYFNALQLKYAEAITCHKSQGGQWDCVFVDCALWQSDVLSLDDLKWLYTALTRAKKMLYLVNFSDSYFG